MPKCRTLPYTGQVAEIYKAFPNPCRVNAYYKTANGKYIYQNSKGYVHLFKVCKEIFMGNVRYTFCDMLLDRTGAWKDTGGYYQTFDNKEQAMQYIEKGENYAGQAEPQVQ